MINSAESIESTEDIEDVAFLGDFPTLDLTGNAVTQDNDAPGIADDGGEFPADLEQIEKLEHVMPAEPADDDAHAVPEAGIL